jgi:hypothetical protein
MLTQGNVNGNSALWLENGLLRVGVLPEKGADIFEITYLPRGIQLLMQTPWGLKPPASQPQGHFLDNYEGGWQELFPSANDACEYRGRAIPFHGEVALLPWQFEVFQEDAAETAVRLWVDCRLTPFRLERTMRLRRGEIRLIIQEKVTNTGSEPFEFVWGHHLTLGGGFLEDGCLLDTPAERLYTSDLLFEPLTARLAPGQDSPWPLATGRDDRPVDLRLIPGPQAHSHDDVFLGSLKRGYYAVSNPRLQLRFTLEWDARVFPWVIFWQPYGGADLPPLTGTYGAGLEPWTARYPLAQAVAAGQAFSLEGGESLETVLAAQVQEF